MPTMIRKTGKAEKIAYSILGTPINMPHKKYRGTVVKEDLATAAQQNQITPDNQATDMVGMLNSLLQNQQQ